MTTQFLDENDGHSKLFSAYTICSRFCFFPLNLAAAVLHQLSNPAPFLQPRWNYDPLSRSCEALSQVESDPATHQYHQFQHEQVRASVVEAVVLQARQR
jgi:hypothetical protein